MLGHARGDGRVAQPRSSLLEHDEAFVNVHRESALAERGRGQRPIRVVGVKFVDEELETLDERSLAAKASLEGLPVGRVQILDRIDLGRVLVEGVERGEHVAHDVTAVVDDDVEGTELLDEGAQELRIRLIPDPHLDLRLCEPCASRDDVRSDDPGERAQVPLPQLQRPALATANLEECHRPIDESSQVTFVRRQVMRPFPGRTTPVIEILRPEAHG
jgi:hypothetical protein